METISIILLIGVSLSMGMFLGALLVFWRMYNHNKALEKELDTKNSILEQIYQHMISFAKFNTKHYQDCRNVYDKLDLYVELKGLDLWEKN